MGDYIGLDVSLKETAVPIRRGGKRVWRGKCLSDPAAITALIRKHAPAAERVVFETGPLSVWFYHALTAEELPAICIDARHAKAALDMAANKTDANDADGLAHLAEVGFFREVRVKSFPATNLLPLSIRERVRQYCRLSLLSVAVSSPSTCNGAALGRTPAEIVSWASCRPSQHLARFIHRAFRNPFRTFMPWPPVWRRQSG